MGAARRGVAWRGVAWRGEAPVLPASSLLLSLSRVSSFIQCGVIRSGPDPHQEIQLPPWNGLFSSLPSLKLSSPSSAKKTYKVLVAELFYRKFSYLLEYVRSNHWRKIKCAAGVSNRLLVENITAVNTRTRTRGFNEIETVWSIFASKLCMTLLSGPRQTHHRDKRRFSCVHNVQVLRDEGVFFN